MMIFFSELSNEKAFPKKVKGSNSLLKDLFSLFKSLALGYFSSSFSINSAPYPLIGEKIAQLELKNIFAVNYLTFLYIPTPAL
jgi:hypothetical protein